MTELSDKEQARIDDLMRIVPKNLSTVLEIGARHGVLTRLLLNHFEHVTALDLAMPSFRMDRVTPVKGDVRNLEFPDQSFDCVFCTEVLEHVPGVEQAAREISRVARHAIVIGVPYKQDLRVARLTCQTCRKSTPAWGHVNSFDERRLGELFPQWHPTNSYVGQQRARTNRIAAWLQDIGSNPYGPYDQEEPCIHCRAKLTAPTDLTLPERLAVAAGIRLQNLHTRFTVPHANWIHVVFGR
jgi:SAM-dependent methyltransferase